MHEQTRLSLHVVAESLLAGHQWRVAHTIRLVVSPGGFATRPLPGEPALLAVRGTDLVVTRETERVLPIAGTLASLAAAAGVEAGPPTGAYPSSTQTDDPLVVDAAAAAGIARAFALGDDALRRLSGSGDAPVLWPEHFDLGVSLDEVNYGVSAGDSNVPQPYAYIGPWTPRVGPFWTEPFGSARPISDFATVDELSAYFTLGRERARTDPRG
jgi:hypothetical protein